MPASTAIASAHLAPEMPGAPLDARFSVAFDYPVHFTSDVFAASNATLARTLGRREPDRRQRAAVFLDEGLVRSRTDLPERIAGYFAAHADSLCLVAMPDVWPGGEAAKSDPDLPARLQARIEGLGIDRQSHVVAVGGGAMLDAVGFAAATTHRGVRLTRLPTTVLAQNDAGIGVKNGVNAFGLKNLLGTFQPPFAVINDIDLLDGLPPRDLRAGMAEAVKVALIRDGAFFAWMEANAGALAAFDRGAVATLIRRCAELHLAQIVRGGDPFETSSARPLDFGHWAAHKLEALSGFALRHGEAVAIGIALDTRYSTLAGLIDEAACGRVCHLLERLGFRLWHDALVRRDRQDGWLLERGLEEFREHLGGDLTVTLLEGIGRGREVHAIDLTRMRDAVAWLEAREVRFPCA